MSLAGPHGEAACRYCNTLVDLDENRRLVRHATRGTHLTCRGSSTYAHTQQRENEDLAFSAEPVTRHCPDCGQLVVVNTVGAYHYAGWRYSYHKLPQLRAAQSWGQPPSDCPQSGQPVPGARTVEVKVQPF